MQPSSSQAQEKTPSVLFVCTANVCRSPMAEALFRAVLAEARQENPRLGEEWQIASAGTWAQDGDPAAARSQWVMAEKGLDIQTHRSRCVTLEMLRSYNLILVMERGHKEALNVEFPELSNRIFLISEMAGYRRDVRDPVLGSLADYRDTARELEFLIRSGFERICRLARGEKPEE